MEWVSSPNQELTPIFVEEEIVYVPVIVFYAGELAVKAYLESLKP